MNEVRRAVRSLVAMPPGPPRYGVAIRAALSMAVPYGVFALMGYPDIGLMFAPGAFMALYAASSNTKDRAKILPFVALILFTSGALGVLFAPWLWAFATGLVLVAVLV